MADSSHDARRATASSEETSDQDTEQRSSDEDLQDDEKYALPRSATLWRWPTEPGRLPRYVREDFRLKAFALMSVQCLVAFIIMTVVDLVLTTKQQRAKVPRYECALLECVVLTALVAMHCFRARSPVNYILFAVFTCLVGISWGLAGNTVGTHVHFQLLGILCTALCVATVSQALALGSSLEGWQAVAAPLFAGWAAASVAVVLLTLCAGWDVLWTLVAMLVSFLQFAIVVFDTRRTFLTCNPDGFMRVIISMDSTLFVIVSAPLVIIWSVFVKGLCMTHDPYDEVEQV